jgi:hypothetical protein
MYSLRLPLPDARLLLTPPWSGLHLALQAGVLLLVCLIPLMLLVWLYRYELALVPRGTALALLGLRLVVLGLLLSLVCLQPIYARDRTEGLPGRVLVAVDRSDSMGVRDPQRPAADKLRLARALRLAGGLCGDGQLAGWIADYERRGAPRWVGEEEARADPARRRHLEEERRQAHDEVCKRVDQLTRADAARLILMPEGAGLLPLLTGKHQVELIGFHREWWELRPDQVGEVSRKPGGGGGGAKTASAPEDGVNSSAFTDLRLPLLQALERSGPGQGKVLGVVLLTDGQHNAGDPPNRKARELGERQLPVYPVALGARRPPPDVAVVSVRAPAAVFKEVEVRVEVKFKITGLKAGDFLVELHRAGDEQGHPGFRSAPPGLRLRKHDARLHRPRAAASRQR